MKKWFSGSNGMAILMLLMAAALGSFCGKMEAGSETAAFFDSEAEKEFVVLVDAGHGTGDS